MKYRLLLACFLTCFLFVFSHVRAEESVDYKTLALNEIQKSGAQSRVYDFSKVLSPQEVISLQYKIDALRKISLNLGIIVVPSTGEESIFDFSIGVAERWKLGNAKTDNGLLIVLSTQDKKIQILTGNGLEGDLPDAKIHRILGETSSEFKNKAYFNGLSLVLEKISLVIDKNSTVMLEQAHASNSNHKMSDESEPKSSYSIKDFLLFIFLILIIFISNKIKYSRVSYSFRFTRNGIKIDRKTELFRRKKEKKSAIDIVLGVISILSSARNHNTKSDGSNESNFGGDFSGGGSSNSFESSENDKK